MAVVIPALNYQPVLDIHTNISIAQPLRSPILLLGNQAVSQAGWWQCDPIGFNPAPINEPLNCVLIYRQLDGMLVLALTFQTIVTAQAIPLRLFASVNSPGLCRP